MEFFYTGIDFVGGGRVMLNTKSFNLNTNEGYYQELKNVLTIKRPKNLPFMRVGSPRDGGYIMIDNLSQGGV